MRMPDAASAVATANIATSANATSLSSAAIDIRYTDRLS